MFDPAPSPRLLAWQRTTDLPHSADAHALFFSLPASERPNAVRMQHEALIDTERHEAGVERRSGPTDPLTDHRLGETAASVSGCGIAALC